MEFTCPICGYGMDAPAIDFNICPSCGTEFGNHDLSFSAEELRDNWILTGPKWWSPVDPKPSNWDPIQQLQRVATGFINPIFAGLGSLLEGTLNPSLDFVSYAQLRLPFDKGDVHGVYTWEQTPVMGTMVVGRVFTQRSFTQRVFPDAFGRGTSIRRVRRGRVRELLPSEIAATNNSHSDNLLNGIINDPRSEANI